MIKRRCPLHTCGELSALSLSFLLLLLPLAFFLLLPLLLFFSPSPFFLLLLLLPSLPRKFHYPLFFFLLTPKPHYLREQRAWREDEDKVKK